MEHEEQSPMGASVKLPCSNRVAPDGGEPEHNFRTDRRSEMDKIAERIKQLRRERKETLRRMGYEVRYDNQHGEMRGYAEVLKLISPQPYTD